MRALNYLQLCFADRRGISQQQTRRHKQAIIITVADDVAKAQICSQKPSQSPSTLNRWAPRQFVSVRWLYSPPDALFTANLTRHRHHIAIVISAVAAKGPSPVPSAAASAEVSSYEVMVFELDILNVVTLES